MQPVTQIASNRAKSSFTSVMTIITLVSNFITARYSHVDNLELKIPKLKVSIRSYRTICMEFDDILVVGTLGKTKSEVLGQTRPS